MAPSNNPVDNNPRTALSTSAYPNGHATRPDPSGRSPARWATSSTSSRRAGRQLPELRNGSASLAATRSTDDVAHRSGGPQPTSTTGVPRPASGVAALSSSASPSESPATQPIGSKAVTRLYAGAPEAPAAPAASSGVPSMTRASARPRAPQDSGTSLSRARHPLSGDFPSMPVTVAPREAAINSASPEPQPSPSTRVPEPTSSRSYTAS